MSDTGRGRDRRRVGDATRARIDDLADGWSVPGDGGETDGTEAAEAPPAASRAKRPSVPPPPPGRSKRASAPPPPPGRSKRESAPPPPPGRSKRESAPPPPRSKRESAPPPGRSKRESAPPPPPGARKKRESVPPPPPGARNKRESAPPPPDPKPEPATEPMERAELSDLIDESSRDDDATRFEPPSERRPSGGQLRRPQVLPKQRGLFGDVAYVFRALFKVTEARRELTELERQLSEERSSREKRLVEIARQGIADDELTMPVVERARERLAGVEEDRSVRAGASAGAEAEIRKLERARSDEAGDHIAQIDALDGEITDIRQRLEPMEKRAAVARNKAAQLHDSLESLDRRIENARGKLVAVKGPKADPSAVEAEIAALRAEREAVAQEEPALATELDELEPQIAALGAARKEAEKSIAELRQREEEARVRTEEMVEAIRARKAVEDRAVTECDRARDLALLDLGEALAVERPPEVATRMRAVDEHDLSIATLERRVIELSELVGGVDRAAIVRGVAVMAGGLIALVLLLILIFG